MQHVIKPEYLYIHIPFCKSICTYCDFIRKIGCSKEIECYVNKIIDELNNKYKDYSFKTIYIGGGTPNSLNDIILDKLLFTCSKLLQQKYEFTIECNPEFVNQKQIDIFKKNKVNRISLGIQSTNNKTLKEIGRKYTIEEAKKAIDLFYLNNINNVSIDFMYGFGNDTTQDIKNDFDFIVNNNIKHYSFYSLELKEGSIMTKQHKKLNDNLIDSLLEKVILLSKQYNYKRYEVSNFAISEQYESLHNKAYWLSEDWVGLGYGAFGFENMNHYTNIGNFQKWTKEDVIYSLAEYYQHILIMGLRLLAGVDLSIKKYKDAYEYYKDKLLYTHINNNHLVCDNINLLDCTLVNIV